MPLRFKCRSCRRQLLLDEVFQGTHCRCQFCRSLLEVPRLSQYAAKRPAVRPDAPPLAASRATQVRRSVDGASQAVPGSRLLPSASRFGFRSLAASSVFGVVLLGALVWSLAAPDRGVSNGFATSISLGMPNFDSESTRPSNAPPDAVRLALLTANPSNTFFSIPVEGETIGYVVDSDESMRPYIQNLAYLSSTVNGALAPGRRYGIVQAVNKSLWRGFHETLQPFTDLVGASAVLERQLVGGKTDLSRAVALAEGWYADQLFLVLSKHIDDAEIERLTQHAEQTGAMTHVIALGEAAKQDLSAIANATGGRFIPVGDDLFRDHVKRTRERQAADRL